MRMEDMDAAIAWYRAVLGFDLIDGPSRRGPGRVGSSIAERSWVDRPSRGVIGGEEPTGRVFIGGANQHANTLALHLRVLSSGIICRRVR
jgi:catechol 2,3-dioxygenase-like lactoylglutathione lyase family enzyme